MWCFSLHSSEFAPGHGSSWSVMPADSHQELGIYLHSNYFIHAIETQGAADRDEWVTSFQLNYKLNNSTFWEDYRNSSGQTVVIFNNIKTCKFVVKCYAGK